LAHWHWDLAVEPVSAVTPKVPFAHESHFVHWAALVAAAYWPLTQA
jgi:hypothetical protein